MSKFDFKKLREQVRSTGEKLKTEFKGTDRQLEAQANWRADTELQEHRLEKLRENTDKIRNSSIKNWQDQQYRERRALSLAEANDREEVKARRKSSAQKLHEDPEYQRRHREGQQALRDDPKRWQAYQEKYNKGNREKLDKPEFWEAYYRGIAQRDSDPEYHRRRIEASKKKICRRVKTPLGIFDSITDAARAHGMGNTETMRNRLKSKNFPEYMLLDEDPES